MLPAMSGMIWSVITSIELALWFTLYRKIIFGYISVLF